MGADDDEVSPIVVDAGLTPGQPFLFSDEFRVVQPERP
jgi:hypothetical protein